MAFEPFWPSFTLLYLTVLLQYNYPEINDSAAQYAYIVNRFSKRVLIINKMKMFICLKVAAKLYQIYYILFECSSSSTSLASCL